MTEVLSTDFSEPGFLKRLRNWRDAMPWLVLGECLSPAMSLIAIGLSLVALHLGAWGATKLERLLNEHANRPVPSAAIYPPTLPQTVSPNLVPRELRVAATPSLISVHEYLTSPLRLMAWQENDGRTVIVRLTQQFWLFAVWMIPAAYVMRRSVLQCAGRERMPSYETLRLAWQRCRSFLSGPALTIGVAMALSLGYVLLGFVDRLPLVGRPIAAIVGLLSLPVALGVGFLLLGTMLTFSLMWVSVMAESYSDGFDGASRGFEYLIQRPFRFVAYVAMALALSIIAVNFASGIISAGISMAGIAYGSTTSTGRPLPPGSLGVLRSLPLAFAINLFWSLSAGVYLLLRRDANHQEIEDVWEPPRPTPKPLPELAVTPSQSEPQS